MNGTSPSLSDGRPNNNSTHPEKEKGKCPMEWYHYVSLIILLFIYGYNMLGWDSWMDSVVAYIYSLYSSSSDEEASSADQDDGAPSSFCPLTREQIDHFMSLFEIPNTDLPWQPYYTQYFGRTGDMPPLPPALSFEYWAVALTAFFVVIVFCWENYLNERQSNSFDIVELPTDLAVAFGKIDQESSKKKKNAVEKEENDEPLLPQLRKKFDKAQTYGKDKIRFARFSCLYEFVETIVFMFMGFLPFIWDLSIKCGKAMPRGGVEGEIGLSLIFLGLTTVIGTITTLPFEWYSTFRIEKKHGFNKMDLKLFFTDKVKGLLLTCVIGSPFLVALLKIIKWGGDNFYVYVWAFMFIFSVFMMTLVPIFIMPLFNKYEPLPEGNLKERINTLAVSLDYPLKKLFVMDGSKRSSHSNAFMFGFWNNKRIVLFDTLIGQVTTDEIIAILGHELGHWKLQHTHWNFIITQLYFGISFYCFSLCFHSTQLYSAFGFDVDQNPVPTIIKLILFYQVVWAPMDKLLSFLMTIFSRMNEFAADRFAFDLGFTKELQSGLCKLHLENLSAMCPDGWYSMYHYSHPPLVERLAAIKDLEKKTA